MNVLFTDDNFTLFRDGFLRTVELTALSGLLALVLGVLLAAFRVSPVPPLRIFGTVWVNVLRNTPLVLLFFAVVFGLPKIGVDLGYFTFAVLALGCYTASFVCETVRSGINTVPLGQAEAARSLGMTFAQTLRLVVLPQATRTVVSPTGSILIALTKNSAIAGAFNNAELYGVMKTWNELGYKIFAIFFWIALGYLVITFAISALFRFLENRLAVAR
ncbi:amino acid ABC transporter permease [Peterkaempfera griseoplana]|uniref:amino acid ABC transporter permease n=1 Tax=Peterkaempfera griseoplana TaxID=66896 RepID=UPI0006E203CC|nr:amino acid ABC transporter permease [Peterkaempfera griseoplana]